MGALFALFTSKKHAKVDLECKGCAFHADDKSSSSEEEFVRKHAMEEKPARRNGDND
jgi:hypothetical protein